MDYFNEFEKILYRNTDIILSTQNKKENGSFSELLFSKISIQSINIKMGNVLEKTWNEFLQLIPNITLLKKELIKGSQVDILFLYNNVVYYFESKNNINLDTEKTIATLNKIMKINDYLSHKFPDNEIISKILVNRYDKVDNIKFYKLPITKEYLFGYSDLFSLFDINVSKNDWEKMFKKLGAYIIQRSDI